MNALLMGLCVMPGLRSARGAHALFQPPRGRRALPPGHQPGQRAVPGLLPARRAALPHRQAPGDAPRRERLSSAGRFNNLPQGQLLIFVMLSIMRTYQILE